MTIEHIEAGQAAQTAGAAKAKKTDGEGFAALFASLNAELRTFAGITPEIALPVGAATQPGEAADRAPLQQDSGRDFGPDRDAGAAENDPQAEDQPVEDGGPGRAADRQTGDEVAAEVAGPADGLIAAATGTAEGAGAVAGQSAAQARTTLTGQDGFVQTATQNARNAPAAQVLTDANGMTQANAQQLSGTQAGREALLSSTSGAYRPGGAADTGPLMAQVTDQGGRVSSQPMANLAASATVNAQIGRSAKPADAAMTDGMIGAEEFTSLRAERFAALGSGKPGNPATAQPNADAAMNGTPERPTTPSAPAPLSAPAPAPSAPQPMAANAAATAGTASQSAGGQLTDPGVATNSSTAQSQTPARTRAPAFAGHMRSAPQAQPTAEQVAIQIQRAIGTGTDRITIQLRPHELGRVDVKMEVGHDGKLLAVISADKPETLDLLQRDQRSLQEALASAGLDVDSSSLSFNLNGQEDEQAVADGNGSQTQPGSEDEADDGEALASDAGGHVDIITDDKIDVLL